MNNHPEYFIMIVQTKSLSAAAARLYVSQPYLSQYLIRLEKEFNVKLFDRTTPLRLTNLNSRNIKPPGVFAETAGSQTTDRKSVV